MQEVFNNCWLNLYPREHQTCTENLLYVRFVPDTEPKVALAIWEPKASDQDTAISTAAYE